MISTGLVAMTARSCHVWGWWSQTAGIKDRTIRDSRRQPTAANVPAAWLRPLRLIVRPGRGVSGAGAERVYGLVRLGAVERGRDVLLRSAAGGVGRNGLAILNAIGAPVVAVVGRESKRQ